ncbi:MAG: hypothetical protein MRJ65_06915 [Candidatus Brocadiaceae bacterium]|nr:hypothetical protein [Candidatus Brocadiaceae bacterium]
MSTCFGCHFERDEHFAGGHQFTGQTVAGKVKIKFLLKNTYLFGTI